VLGFKRTWDSIPHVPEMHFTVDTVSISNFLVSYWYVVVLLFFFWPVWVNLLFALATASGWAFWLVTSIILGCIQIVYASYQFLCIAVDILMLSVLKTFAMLRGQILQISMMSGLVKGRSKSRRREWKEKLRQASTFGDFLELSTEEPKELHVHQRNPKRKGHWSKLRGAAVAIGQLMKSLMGEKTNSDATRTSNKTAATSPKNNNNHSQIQASDYLKNRIEPSTPPQSPSSSRTQQQMRKSQSCMDFSPNKMKRWQRRQRMLEDHDDDSDAGDDTSETCELSDESSPPIAPAGTTTPPPLTSLPLPRRSSSRSFQNSHSLSATDLLTISPSKSRDDNLQTSHEHRAFLDCVEKELGMAGGLLITTTGRLHEARMQAINGGDTSPLKFLLAGVVKRNHLSVDDILTEDARAIAECGRHYYSQVARDVVTDFIEEVEECLHFLAHSPVTSNMLPRHGNLPQSMLGTSSSSSSLNNGMNAETTELADRIKHLSKMKMNTGCSALMLSGGGAQAMYHVGTIRALVESKVWGDIPVISGTSGGSISAAMCAMKTEEELLRDICVSHVSTDYLLTGRMKEGNIRWFPTLWEMGRNWLKSGILVDSKEFKRCCDFYFGDMTFEEAYQRTRKHVCITVSASRCNTGGAQRLLLNHISTPHVTLSSAVVASCALPGVMKPAKLMAKDGSGNQVVFEVDGVEWIDGSVQADLPFKRISTLFNVSNFIVAQVNFHVVPFLNKAYHPSTKSLYWKLFQVTEWDVRSRALNLARLGLFPRIFGQDVSKVFKQKYHGNITLVPKFTMMQVFGMQVLSNPTVADMKLYIESGQKSAWPYLDSIKTMLRLEKAIDECLAVLKDRFHQMPPDLQNIADIDSVSSTAMGQTHSYGANTSRDQSFFKVKMKSLEAENALLRKKVLEMERTISQTSLAN
jgi:predicted acylesterase/phospholipase RssA